MGRLDTSRADWWRDAVVYQLYVRSFADGDGDGVGDIAGLRSRLDHLVDLGVDGLWINPWYRSPMADGGYDVADYRDIDPLFGDLAAAETLVEEAHARGLRVLLDLVPNHTSEQHPWFRAALAAGPGSPERRRYLIRPGRGDGSDPPNDWTSVFGGSAWARIVEPDGRGGEWYLHLFAPEQPDLDWTSPEVRAEFQSILRFWFDRGVDGFRIDVANTLAKHPGLPDLASTAGEAIEHPFSDRDDVHSIYRSWRAIADAYDPPRVLIAEAWVDTPDRLARYVRPDQLHGAFDFDLLASPWRAHRLRDAIDAGIAATRAVGAAPTWVLSNHDVVRPATRYAYPQPDDPAARIKSLTDLPADVTPDPDLGRQRARAAALLLLALPGAAYLYQGEELGLPEVVDLPDVVRRDPIYLRTAGRDPGRDGCRVPLPWSGEASPFGFGPPGGAAPWLPQPRTWAALTVAAQSADPDSTLRLYRAALRIRRADPGLRGDGFRWVDVPRGTLAFGRDAGFACLVTVDETAEAILPNGAVVLLASRPLPDRHVPPSTAVWFRA